MRGFVAALGAVLVCGLAALVGLVPAEAKETEEFRLGQWTAFVFVEDNTGQFTDCTIWAANSADMYVGISVNKNWKLDLYLNSKAWNLPLNQSYPISYWIDRNAIYHGKAETYSEKYVQIGVERGQAVFDELRSGSQLTFRTQSDDYVFNLRDSNAALNRLLDCVDKYAKQATTTNPFGDGSTEPQNSSDQSAQQGFGGDQQQQGGTSSGSEQQASTDPSTNTMKLKSLTQSSDQVEQFLVDVTGAKPSMITVEAKSFKSGAPYYHFSTPIGQGDFWQEYLGKDTLQSVAIGYLDSYEGECKGKVERAPAEPIEGKQGQLATGTATCSDSPYQDGSEVLSYSMTTSGDVVSIYITYVGGNAAKAKTDSLGRLIARRQEAEIQ
jgi:hypothetical protein